MYTNYLNRELITTDSQNSKNDKDVIVHPKNHHRIVTIQCMRELSMIWMYGPEGNIAITMWSVIKLVYKWFISVRLLLHIKGDCTIPVHLFQPLTCRARAVTHQLPVGTVGFTLALPNGRHAHYKKIIRFWCWEVLDSKVRISNFRRETASNRNTLFLAVWPEAI